VENCVSYTCNYLSGAKNATLRVDYFRMQEVLNICISIQNQSNSFLGYLSVTYFQFQYLLLTFYRMAET